MKALLLLISLIGVLKADDVLQLEDSDFESKLADTDTALVMFFAPWCGHCKRLKPEFEKAGSILKDNDPPIALVKVDCTEGGKETCNKFGVSGYPTLKIFRNGELSSDYNGPREVNGIVKYMRSQVGPVSKDLSSIEEAEKFLSKNEVAVVYFGEGSLKDAFMKVADKLRETVRFGHSTSSDVDKKYGHKDAVVLFRSPLLANKFEPSNVVYSGSDDKSKIEEFIKENYHGLVGHRTPDSVQDFKSPLVVAYYNVDYVKNPKGTNYWRNRILKVAQSFKDDFTFAVASKDDFQHEINEFGIDFVPGDKPVVCARNAKDKKFVMKDEFTMENFEVFLEQLKGDELEAYIKSEAVPDNEGAAVKVAVAKNFDELVTDMERCLVILAPWLATARNWLQFLMNWEKNVKL
ncbi:Protein disulfide-isomerase A3 [Armadillidium vulgare]|nr:Protein disulfide-isomerase A3 [Armadillidium vulgare]